MWVPLFYFYFFCIFQKQFHLIGKWLIQNELLFLTRMFCLFLATSRTCKWQYTEDWTQCCNKQVQSKPDPLSLPKSYVWSTQQGMLVRNAREPLWPLFRVYFIYRHDGQRFGVSARFGISVVSKPDWLETGSQLSTWASW